METDETIFGIPVREAPLNNQALMLSGGIVLSNQILVCNKKMYNWFKKNEPKVFSAFANVLIKKYAKKIVIIELEKLKLGDPTERNLIADRPKSYWQSASVLNQLFRDSNVLIED